MRFLIQAPNFVGIYTFPGWSFLDIVPSSIFQFQLVSSGWNFQTRDPPTKLFFLALLVRFKVPITNFFYFLIQLYTSRNWRFGKNFFDSDQKRFFYDFFVFEICRHFVPPFALVSSRLDWSSGVGSRTLIPLKPSDLVVSFSIVENIPWKMPERCVAACYKR